jgi:uncharacterized protein YyaL (SSP411 family)
MTFVQGITGGGGWPLTVFLAPDLTPFFGGTYFPPKTVGQHLGFPEVLRLIQQKYCNPTHYQALSVLLRWVTNKEELKQSGIEVLKAIERASVFLGQPDDQHVTESRMRNANKEAFKHLEHTYDRVFGGFGGAPKFPSPSTLTLLLREAFNKKSEYGTLASEMLLGTLEKMVKGGIHDHIEGGFHRYSVDRQWHLAQYKHYINKFCMINSI